MNEFTGAAIIVSSTILSSVLINSLLAVPWWMYILAPTLILFPLSRRFDLNFIRLYLDQKETKQLTAAYNAGMTWEQYKQQHHIKTDEKKGSA